MKTGMIGRWMAVWVGVLLATAPVVSANHVATAKGAFAVASGVVFQVHFMVANPVPALQLPEGLRMLQVEWVPTGGSLSLEAARIQTLTIDTQPDNSRTATMTGQLVSTAILGEGPTRQPFAELVSFTAIGLDTAISGAGPDAFSLTLVYQADEPQGPLLASLGFGTCEAMTCTITFTGPLTEGDLFVHTAGDGA
jgi:hypothetical protein